MLPSQLGLTKQSTMTQQLKMEGMLSTLKADQFATSHRVMHEGFLTDPPSVLPYLCLEVKDHPIGRGGTLSLHAECLDNRKGHWDKTR